MTIMIGLGLAPARGAGGGTGGGTGGGGTGTGGGGTGTPAPLTAIAAEGWRAVHADIAAFQPGQAFTVRRPGFDAAGGPVTVAEEIATTARLRLPWPDQDALTADEVALSDVIRAGDIVEGVPNGSEIPLPRPVAMWLHPDRVRAEGASFTARLAVAHRYARAGRPVAAVRLVLSDGDRSVEALVSDMEVISYPASGMSMPHFTAALDLSAFAPGALLTLDAVIYPWVGELYDTRLHGAPAPSISFGTTRVVKGAPSRFAYVDAAAGSDAAGAASADAATAASAPFATLAAAALAAGGDGAVRLRPGSHLLSGFSGVSAGAAALLIEAADPGQETVLQAPASNLSGGLPARVHLRGLTIRKGSASNYYVLDSNAAAGSENMLVAEGCRFDDAGFGRMGTAFLGRVGRAWMIGCTATAAEATALFSTNCLMVNLIGCGDFMGGTAVYNVAGCRGRELYFTDIGGSTATLETPLGLFAGFSHMSRNSVSGGCVSMANPVGPAGLALVGCVFEGLDGGQPVVRLHADGNVQPVQNLLVQQCTVVGQRVNFLYQDTGTARVDKEGSICFSVLLTRNSKTDVFGQDGNLVGNWGVAHRAGFRSNAVLKGDDSGKFEPGPGIWVGEITEAGTAIGSPAAPLDPDWGLDASASGTGAGGGDYRPGPAHALPRIPAGEAPYPCDLLGAPLPDDGTAVVGACQP